MRTGVASRRHSLLANSGFSLLGDLTARAGMFAAFLIAARLLPTSEYARVGVAMALVMLAVAVLDAGFATLIIRDGAPGPSNRHGILTSSLAARTPIVIASVVAGVSIGIAGGQLGLALVVLASGIVNAAQLSLFAVFRAAQSFAVEAYAKAACGASYPVLAAAMLLAGQRSAVGVMIAVTLGPLASLPVLSLLARGHLASGVRTPPVPTLRAAAPFAVMAISTIAYYRAGTIMLGWLSTAGQTAAFATASTVALGLLMLPGAVANSLLPNLAAGQGLPEQTRAARAALLIGSGCIAVVAALASLLAPWAIPLAFGHRYANAAGPFVVLALTTIPIGACSILGAFLAALQRTRVLVGQVLIALAINLAANAVLIPAAGALGASLSTALTELVSFAIIAVAAERLAPGVLLGRLRTPAGQARGSVVVT